MEQNKDTNLLARSVMQGIKEGPVDVFLSITPDKKINKMVVAEAGRHDFVSFVDSAAKDFRNNGGGNDDLLVHYRFPFTNMIPEPDGKQGNAQWLEEITKVAVDTGISPMSQMDLFEPAV